MENFVRLNDVSFDGSDGEWTFVVGPPNYSSLQVQGRAIPKEVLLALHEFASSALDDHELREIDIYRQRKKLEEGGS